MAPAVRSAVPTVRIVALLAALCAIPSVDARAQAPGPGFCTGLCVAPDTSSSILDPALGAVVGTPERAPVAIPSSLPPCPDEVRRDGYRGRVVLAVVARLRYQAVQPFFYSATIK